VHFRKCRVLVSPCVGVDISVGVSYSMMNLGGRRLATREIVSLKAPKVWQQRIFAGNIPLDSCGRKEESEAL
jgi:hypothetical protein